MDFSEDFEVSTPCLIVQSSQNETSQRICQSDSDPFFLKQLNISRSTDESSKIKSLDDQSLESDRSNPRIVEESIGAKQCGIMRIAGGSEGGNANQSTSDQRGTQHNPSSDAPRHAQTCPAQGPGGGGGAGGDDGDDNRDNSHQEPSTYEEETSHSEPGTASSSDSFPELIKSTTRDIPVMMNSPRGGSSQSDNSVTSASCCPEITISQASTAVVGEDTGVPSLVKKSSSSSSSGDYRSDLTSSSAYQASISSTELSTLSSDSHGASSGAHYPLPLAVRTQAELDTSSTSASSEGQGGPGSQKIRRFSNLESIDEDVDNQDHSMRDSNKDQVEQECSSQEDLFGYNKEDSTVISSQEVSRLCTPQDRSTPVEQKLSQDKGSGYTSSLYRQVLSVRRTSTPVESNQSPPTENTPNQSFQCFQFSGEEVKESSDSSSSPGVVKTSSPGVPTIIPASPTSTISKQSSSSSSSQSALQNTTSQSAKTKASDSSVSSLEHLSPSPSSFQYPWRKERFQRSPEEEEEEEEAEAEEKEEDDDEQKKSLENDDEEFVGLPRWQKELIQKDKKEQSVSSKSQSPSTSSSSSSLEKEQHLDSEQHYMQHSWQSEMPSTVEGSKSSFLSKKHDSRSSEVKRVTFLMDDDDSEPSKKTQIKSTIEIRKPESIGIAESLSPSSIDGQKFLAKDDGPNVKETTQTSVVGEHGPTACTQPNLSQDVFRPLLFSTQEDTQKKNRQLDSNAPEDQEEPDDQDIDSQFDLHFSQSQTDMDDDSPPLIPDPGSPPLTTFVSPKDGGSGSSPDPPSISASADPTSTASPDATHEVILPLSLLLKNPNSLSISTPSQSILEPVVKDTVGDYRSLEQHEERAAEGLESVTISKPSALDEKDDAVEKSPDMVPVPALSSETSSDSITGHFSLPTSTEPLRPVTCTTPPPMRSRQAAVPTTVCETPGIFSQDSSNITATTSTTKMTPSLTLSMARQNESDSEIFFQIPNATCSSSSSTDPLEASRTMEYVFVQAQDKTSSSRRREIHKDQEYNPYEFTSQDDDVTSRPPMSRRKSRKRLLEASKEKGSSRESGPQVNKITRVESSRETNVDERNKTPDNVKGDSGQSTAASGEDSSVQIFHRVTKTKIVKKITTEVVKHVTITLTKQGQENKVFDQVGYVEDERPTVDHVVNYETDKVDIIERDGSIIEIVRRPSTPPTQPPIIPNESPRRSPRGKKRTNENKETLQSGKRQKTDDKANEKTTAPKKNETHKDEDGPPPLLRRESTEKIVETKAGNSRTPEPALDLVPGTRVFAHWSDNHFYPGVLTSGASKAGYYNVAFDDGDKRKVRAERLIRRDSLHTGQHVLAQDADGYYDPGVIVGHYRKEDENGYEIKNQKGGIQRYPSRNVILTEEQAAAILSSSLSRTSSSSVSAGGLDKSTRSTERSSSSNISSGGLSTRSRDTSSKDTSCSSNDLTRGGAITSPSKSTDPTDETPKSSRKKSFKKNRKAAPSSWRGDQKESSSEASSDERKKNTRGKLKARKDLGLGKIPTRTSPRKRETAAEEKEDDQDAEPSALGTLPSNESLFAGFAFLITGSHNSKEKESKNDTDSETETIEFRREQLVLQIEAGGGVILKEFDETQNSGADQCFLISSSHQRTRKFFQCLAYDIPIVHHSWIHDSSILNELQDYKKYLLPAGTSLETGEIMECQTQPKPKVLQGQKIFLHGSNQFKKTWSSVVLAAGCSVVAKLPNRPGRAAQLDDFDTMCDVIISGTNTLPASIRHTVEMLGIPVVALEWLFQCLINGFLVPFDGHPKYDYKNIQKDDNL